MMKVYKITGTYKDEPDTYEFGIYSTYEKAEQHVRNEINAYTFNSVCDWSFEIIEIEVM